MHTKLFYATMASSLLLLSNLTYAQDPQIQQKAEQSQQKPEEEIIAEFIACIKNFEDKRTYIQFIDSVIAKVKNHEGYLVEYFKKFYPKLSFNGFIAALEAARKATSPYTAGTALYNYAQLLPKEITYPALLMGMTKRMKVA